MNKQDAANSIALSRIMADPNARDMLTIPEGGNPKVYLIDQIIRVKGAIKVSADYQRTPTVDIPIIETLALFMKYCGVTGEFAANALFKAMTDAVNKDKTGQGEILAALPIINATMDKVKAKLAALPKVDIKGPVNVALSVTPMPIPAAT